MVICRIVKERWWKMKWVVVRLRWVGRRTHRHTYTHIHTHMHTHIHTQIHTHIYSHTHIHTYTHTYTDTHIHTHTHHVPCRSNGRVPCVSNEIRDSIDNQTCHNHQFEQSASQNGLRWTLDSAINVCVCECVYVYVSFFLFLLCYHQPVSHAFLLHNTTSLSFDLIPRLSPCSLAILCR